ncbi:MAG: DUF2905 family protein [Actinomycetota bacterium]
MLSAGKILLLIGVILIVVGALVILLGRLGITSLPGDISFRRGNFQLFIPIGTSILLSIVLTILLNLLLRR